MHPPRTSRKVAKANCPNAGGNSLNIIPPKFSRKISGVWDWPVEATSSSSSSTPAAAPAPTVGPATVQPVAAPSSASAVVPPAPVPLPGPPQLAPQAPPAPSNNAASSHSTTNVISRKVASTWYWPVKGTASSSSVNPTVAPPHSAGTATTQHAVGPSFSFVLPAPVPQMGPPQLEPQAPPAPSNTTMQAPQPAKQKKRKRAPRLTVRKGRRHTRVSESADKENNADEQPSAPPAPAIVSSAGGSGQSDLDFRPKKRVRLIMPNVEPNAMVPRGQKRDGEGEDAPLAAANEQHLPRALEKIANKDANGMSSKLPDGVRIIRSSY